MKRWLKRYWNYPRCQNSVEEDAHFIKYVIFAIYCLSTIIVSQYIRQVKDGTLIAH